MNSPHWDGKRWRIQARKDGRRYSFSSSVAGAKGRKECQRKFDNWYYGEASGEKTVAQVCKEFLADVEARCGEHSPSLEQYECYIRLYVAPVCASKKICKMTLRDWQNVLNNAHGRNKALSEKTLKNLRGIIMGLVRFAYEDYQCEMLRGKLYIPKGHPTQEKEILQPDQVRRLLESSDIWFHSLFAFLLVTGVRPSEALGLQLDDIYEDYAVIRRGVNARGHITDGKNANARRMIPLGNMAKSILQETIERNDRMNLHTKWIFCSRDGSQGNQGRMRKQWQKLKEERQLTGTVYSLRHTFISYMKNVMPEAMIKDIVGHSVSMKTIDGAYSHIVDGDRTKAAQVIDLTFGKVEQAKENPVI